MSSNEINNNYSNNHEIQMPNGGIIIGRSNNNCGAAWDCTVLAFGNGVVPNEAPNASLRVVIETLRTDGSRIQLEVSASTLEEYRVLSSVSATLLRDMIRENHQQEMDELDRQHQQEMDGIGSRDGRIGTSASRTHGRNESSGVSCPSASTRDGGVPPSTWKESGLKI